MSDYAPYIPTPPPGWSIGPNGEQISPDGEVAEAGSAPTGAFPVLSTLAGVVAGKMIGKSTTAMVAGGIIGYWLKPLE